MSSSSVISRFTVIRTLASRELVAGNIKLDHCINVDILDYGYSTISAGRPSPACKKLFINDLTAAVRT